MIARQGVDVDFSVEEAQVQASVAPDAVYKQPVDSIPGVAGGLALQAGKIFDQYVAKERVLAKTQGAVDEFAGVSNSEKNANFLTRDQYESGVARQSVTTALSKFQLEAAKRAQEAAEAGISPEAFVKMEQQSLAKLLATQGLHKGLDNEDTNAFLNSANSTLSSAGHMYTKVYAAQRKAEQEGTINATTAQANRNIMESAGAPPDVMRATVNAGIDKITSVDAPYAKEYQQAAVISYIGEVGKTVSTMGVPGVVLANDVRKDITGSKYFQNSTPEQQATINAAMRKMTDDAGLGELIKHQSAIDTAIIGAQMGQAINMDAARHSAEQVGVLERMGAAPVGSYYRAREQVERASLENYKLNDRIAKGEVMGNKAALESTVPITEAQATKGLTDLTLNLMTGPNALPPREAGVVAAIQTYSQGQRGDNIYQVKAASKAMREQVQGILAETTDSKGNISTVSEGFINYLRTEYEKRGTNGSMWNALTAGMAKEGELLNEVFASGSTTASAYVMGLKEANELYIAPLPPGIPRALVEAGTSASALGKHMTTMVPGFIVNLQEFAYDPDKPRQLAEVYAKDAYKLAAQSELTSAMDADDVSEAVSARMAKSSFEVDGVSSKVYVDPAMANFGAHVFLSSGEPTEHMKGLIQRKVDEYQLKVKSKVDLFAVKVVLDGNGRASLRGVSGTGRSTKFDLDLGQLTQAQLQESMAAQDGKRAKERLDAAHSRIEIASVLGGNHVVTGRNIHNVPAAAAVDAGTMLVYASKPGSFGRTGEAEQAIADATPAAKEAMQTLGLSLSNEKTREGLVGRSAFRVLAATEAALGKGSAAKLAQRLKEVQASPETTDDVALEAELRGMYGAKIPDKVWRSMFLPSLRDAILK